MRTRFRTEHPTPEQRSGFTLLEILIVASVMVMLAAFVSPTIVSIYREAWISEQTNEVRELMGRARRLAIEEGVDYKFHYELGGNHAVVLPAENEEDVSEGSSESGQSTTVKEFDRALLELSEELKMRTPEGVEEEGESIDQERFGSLVGNQLEDKTWSKGIKFRFDGTSDDFELRVIDESTELACNVTLRGLTGSVRTTQVYSEAD